MPEVITRAEWGARYGRGNDVSHLEPWGEIVVHTEAGAVRKQDWPVLDELAALNLSLDERTKMRAIESYHSATLGWNGFGYSFAFFPDGTICEGRGWGRSGSHTEGRNSTAAGFCVIGHGDLQPATGAQWASMAWLIGEGIRLGHVKPNPKISGHRNYSKKGKSCPGDLIYPHIGRLRGITGPAPIITPEVPEMDDAERQLMRDVLDAARDAAAQARGAAVYAQAVEQRVTRIETALNIDDVNTVHDGKKPYPGRTIASLTRIENEHLPKLGDRLEVIEQRLGKS
jgi:hypothetical protein